MVRRGGGMFEADAPVPAQFPAPPAAQRKRSVAPGGAAKLARPEAFLRSALGRGDGEKGAQEGEMRLRRCVARPLQHC
jgi:hypothetical protein